MGTSLIIVLRRRGLICIITSRSMTVFSMVIPTRLGYSIRSYGLSASRILEKSPTQWPTPGSAELDYHTQQNARSMFIGIFLVIIVDPGTQRTCRLLGPCLRIPIEINVPSSRRPVAALGAPHSSVTAIAQGPVRQYPS